MFRLTLLFTILLLGVLFLDTSSAFFVVSNQVPAGTTQRQTTLLFLSDNNNNNNSEEKLKALGYSDDEIQRSKPQKEDISVRVDLVDDVDATTLTALGFGLIAINFFVLANMGDGGIAGFIASIINTMRE